MPLSLQPYGILAFAVLAGIIVINEVVKYLKSRQL